MSSSTFTHVQPSCHDLMLRDKAARAIFIKKDRFVTYARAKNILNKLQNLVYAPRKSRASGLILSGPPGTGKTALMLALQRRAEARIPKTANMRWAPVVKIDMSGARDARTIFNRTLEALGTPVTSSMRIPDREQLALRLLRQAGARLFVLDEIQSVLSATDRQQMVALDTIKLIMNSLSLPIVATGDRAAMNAFRSDPHLAARFDYAELPPWKFDNDSRDFLDALEKVLPLRKPSHLSSATMHAYLIKKSDGILSTLIRLIEGAALFAIETEEERITETLVERASIEAPSANLLLDDE